MVSCVKKRAGKDHSRNVVLTMKTLYQKMRDWNSKLKFLNDKDQIKRKPVVPPLDEHHLDVGHLISI
jgi:hypothetical protein